MLDEDDDEIEENGSRKDGEMVPSADELDSHDVSSAIT